jgi:predicted glycogen debranching enzyme
MAIQFGREICGNLAIAQSREWLVTNGIGGYASGTIAGVLTRRYHGLLVAALNPPLGRTVLVSQLEEVVQYNHHHYPLYTNRWATDGAIAPHGYRYLESFALEGTTPVWRYACADALLEKRIWMQPGENTTYVRYTLRRASEPLILGIKAFVNYRDYHGETHSNDWQMELKPLENGLRAQAFPTATPFYLFATLERQTQTSNPKQTPGIHEPKWRMAYTWYRDFDMAAERYRGLCDREDRLHAADLQIMLNPGDSIVAIATTSPQPQLQGSEAYRSRRRYERQLLNSFPHKEAAPTWIKQLVLAADQFIVKRPLPQHPEGQTVIAGYHWFGDWGRDTAIALPGLTLTTGRPEIARRILRTFACYLDQGMLPNIFPDAGENPAYNSVDAVLWYFEAVRAYYAATGDRATLDELYPVLVKTIDWHRRGTRYNIHLDSSDGLIYAGETGVQLTWMDAKVDNWVVTPRIGKPIEVNALWYNALVIMAQFARILDRPAREYEQMAAQTARGMERFWNDRAGYCYDVLDGPDGDDASLRPNQILAVSLPVEGLNQAPSPLSPVQQRRVLKAVSRSLLTSYGLRSLSPDDPQYQGVYGGDLVQRDGSYHQGTVWGWLIGHFIQAHLRVYGNPQLAREFLALMAHHLQDACVGSLSEIFDGNPPFTPRGAVAQAWTVAEVLRAWELLATAAKA